MVIGPNGGGKTTLVKIALGLLCPEEGAVWVFGAPPAQGAPAVGYVPQDVGRNRDFPITAMEVVLQGRLGMARRGGWRYTGEDRRAARAAMELMGMEGYLHCPMGCLSQGQRQRVLIARGLASKPRMLLLDEPLASIDQESRDVLLTTLSSLTDMTVIMVSHDMSAITGRTTAVACVNRTVFYHDAGEILPEMVQSVYGNCPVELIAHGIPHRVLAVHDRDGEECSHD